MYLSVTSPFSTYNRGDTITNATTIATILASAWANFVVQVGYSAVALPNFFTGFIGLGSGSASFVEMVGSGYARVACTLSPMIAGQVSSTTGSTFTATGTWPTQTQFGLFDANGTLILWWPTATPVTLTNGQSQTNAVGAFSIKIPDLINPPATASVIFAGSTSLGSTPTGAAVYSGLPIYVANGKVAAM